MSLLPERRPEGPNTGFVEFVRIERDADREVFDRIRYAKELLRLLKPKGLTVALCPGVERLHTEVGSSFEGPGRRWAIMLIPGQASRAAIALEVARLAGREREPYLLDTLLRVRPA
ncbi:MAG: hypothetical protein U0165_05670 [Polyangiaceae bacterium]